MYVLSNNNILASCFITCPPMPNSLIIINFPIWCIVYFPRVLNKLESCLTGFHIMRPYFCSFGIHRIFFSRHVVEVICCRITSSDPSIIASNLRIRNLTYFSLSFFSQEQWYSFDLIVAIRFRHCRCVNETFRLYLRKLIYIIPLIYFGCLSAAFFRSLSLLSHLSRLIWTSSLIR